MSTLPQRWIWDPDLRTHRVEDEQKPDGQQLYHVGCGRCLFTREDVRRGTMALACTCGANSPIVVPDLDDPNPPSDVLPASLVWTLQRCRIPPHLEYYLGFSDFTCPAKEAWERFLREYGSISFAECPEERCRNLYTQKGRLR